MDDGTKPAGALATRETIAELVALYEQSAAEIRQAYDLLSAAKDRLDGHFGARDYNGSVRLRNRRGQEVDFGNVADVLGGLELEVWGYLTDRLELRRFLSVKRAEELDKMLTGKSEETFPPLTIDNVLAFANGWRSQIGTMLEEAIQEVFEWLRPRHSPYKRNSELEIPRRIILERVVDQTWRGDAFRVDYYRQAQVTALQNVFSALDGKGSVAETYRGALHDAINASGRSGVGETDYFRFRCYQNKNLHLEFKRLDLLKRLNQIAGGKRLRPATVAA